MLTPKQKEILDFIQAFSAEHGYAPSQHEIARHFGFKSLGTVQNYLVRLERQGALRKTWNARRGMQVVAPQPHDTSHPSASGTVPLPLLGRVAAGRPIEAVQSDETIDVPTSMIGRGSHFVLRVKGDSMIDVGILDGDYAVIRKQSNAENGQTVVALIENEATIKKYYHHADHVELRAANPAYEPIRVSTELKIEGILSGVIRVLK